MPGTAPTGWKTPKTSYTADDVLTPEQFERIEGNAYATELGNRTIDPTVAPTGNVGTLRQFLDWFANRIRAILGTTNWHDAPPTTLQAAKSHIDAAAPHSGHETPTGAQAKVDTHAAGTSVHGATSAATASRIMMRDANGRAKVAAPAVDADIATKGYVDDAVVAAKYRTFVIGDTLLQSHDAETQGQGIKKTITTPFQGFFRARVKIRSHDGSATSRVKIIRNDDTSDILGYSKETTSGTYVEFTWDLRQMVYPGDRIQVMVEGIAAAKPYIKDFRLYGTEWIPAPWFVNS